MVLQQEINNCVNQNMLVRPSGPVHLNFSFEKLGFSRCIQAAKEIMNLCLTTTRFWLLEVALKRCQPLLKPCNGWWYKRTYTRLKPLSLMIIENGDDIRIVVYWTLNLVQELWLVSSLRYNLVFSFLQRYSEMSFGAMSKTGNLKSILGPGRDLKPEKLPPVTYVEHSMRWPAIKRWASRL